MELVDIVKSFIEYGIFAALFVYLFLKTQKDYKERENSYITVISEYGEQLANNTQTLEKVCETLEDIKEELKK